MSLRPIARAVKDWSPAGSERHDPITAIALAWPTIVGANVAQHTRPSAIAQDALVVTTRSSAWSQQLSFLTEEILRGLHAIPELRVIARLRFRVGRIGGRGAPRHVPSAPSRVRRQQAAEPLGPEATPADALARLRASVAARRGRAVAACPRCGAAQAEPVHCAPCAEELARVRRTDVQRLMYDAPWLGYDGTAKLILGLTHEEYAACRASLLARWSAVLARLRWARRVSDVERRVSSSFVLLQSGLEPDRITPAVVRTVLGDEVCALLEASHRPRRS
jgi:Dna[CI] antecedent DciA-like protein